MKKIFTGFLLTSTLLLALFVLYRSLPKEEASPTPLPEVLGLPQDQIPDTAPDILDLEVNSLVLRVAWLEVDTADKITLSSNLDNLLPASHLVEENKCLSLINAGFYTKDYKPVGLFITEGQEVQSWSQNSLFNGIFSVNQFATPRITSSVPKDPLRVALQTGPILIENSMTKKLALENDKPSRRAIVATTGENNIFFIIVYSKESVYLGPYLKDLPLVLERFGQKISKEFADAINLDGGTASAFYTDFLTLPELSPIGSYFCIR